MKHDREKEDGLGPIAEWMRSDSPPFGEEDHAAMRRGVWRSIEARRPESAFRRGRFLFSLALGTGLAAVLVAVIWLRPPAESPAASALLPPTVSTPVAVAAAPGPPLVESVPAGPARPSAPRKPRARAAEGVPVRIEFQTANPEVRIIWLVKKGEAAPRPFSASPGQEVS